MSTIEQPQRSTKQCCRELFERSEKNGDIYLDTYSGWYNVREETFVTETEAKEMDYKDPVSGKPLKQMEEESFFFRQSKYQARLIEHIENHPEFIQPEGRKGEILYRLKNDELRDLSVSRTTFDWGIPVPGNSKHVLYVWFDALTNYLTGCDFPNGENYFKFWRPECTHHRERYHLVPLRHLAVHVDELQHRLAESCVRARLCHRSGWTENVQIYRERR